MLYQIIRKGCAAGVPWVIVRIDHPSLSDRETVLWLDSDSDFHRSIEIEISLLLERRKKLGLK